MELYSILLLVISLAEAVKIFPAKSGEDYDYWMRKGREELDTALKRLSYIRGNASNRFLRRPKNVIVFVGDGMSITTSTASRIYKGQQVHQSAGEDHLLVWDTFPEMALIKTYNTDRQTPDSAGTSTAIFTGIKTKYSVIGYDDTVELGSAKSARNARKLDSIISWGQEVGKKTGIVTTTRLTHATPASLYANSPHRDWECDKALKRDNGVGDDTLIAEGEENPDYEENPDIARQLIKGKTGKAINIMLGGGLRGFKAIPGMKKGSSACVREDGRDLIQEWTDDQKAAGNQARFINNTRQLLELDTAKLDRVLGIFANSHMDYNYARDKGPEGQPSLAQMATTAVRMLRNNDGKGFVLAVESGRIDHAHHDNYANRALDETAAFDEAIRDIIDMLEEGILDDTLIIVTADHSHVMTMMGYPKRGTDIRGVTGDKTVEGLQEAILSYANGVGQQPMYPSDPNVEDGKCKRAELDDEAMKLFDYQHPAGVYDSGEHHGGDDVALWAMGPMSYLFHKTHEQSYIAHVIAYSLCIGPYANDRECLKENVTSGSAWRTAFDAIKKVVS